MKSILHFCSFCNVPPPPKFNIKLNYFFSIPKVVQNVVEIRMCRMMHQIKCSLCYGTKSKKIKYKNMEDVINNIPFGCGGPLPRWSIITYTKIKTQIFLTSQMTLFKGFNKDFERFLKVCTNENFENCNVENVVAPVSQNHSHTICSNSFYSLLYTPCTISILKHARLFLANFNVTQRERDKNVDVESKHVRHLDLFGQWNN